MIVEHNIRIRNRTDLMLSIEQARRERFEHMQLLDHNLTAVYEKWTVKRLFSHLVSKSAPTFLGSAMAYLSTLMLPTGNRFAEKKQSQWGKIFKGALRSFLPPILRRFV